MDKPHVLDILAKKQGCFVSDLRLNPVNRRAALADLLLLDDSAFLLKEWKEAVTSRGQRGFLTMYRWSSGISECICYGRCSYAKSRAGKTIRRHDSNGT